MHSSQHWRPWERKNSGCSLTQGNHGYTLSPRNKGELVSPLSKEFRFNSPLQVHMESYSEGKEDSDCTVEDSLDCDMFETSPEPSSPPRSTSSLALQADVVQGQGKQKTSGKNSSRFYLTPPLTPTKLPNPTRKPAGVKKASRASKSSTPNEIPRGVTSIEDIITQWERGAGKHCPPLGEWTVQMRRKERSIFSKRKRLYTEYKSLGSVKAFHAKWGLTPIGKVYAQLSGCNRRTLRKQELNVLAD